MFVKISSVGAYVPNTQITNSDFEKILDTTDAWITKRTGIKTRYKAQDDEHTSDMGLKAADLALKRAQLTPNDLDAIICATITPDYLCMPSTACIIAKKMGCRNITAFDISAACSGFIYALELAYTYIKSVQKRNVLIIGAEKMSKIMDYTDRTTCVLFGDGAGAAIISADKTQEKSILDVHTSSDGKYYDFLLTSLDKEKRFLQMKGNETFKIAVKTLTNDVINILKNNQKTSNDLQHFIPHQANHRIISAVGTTLNLEPHKVVLTVGKYGNTSSASIPMAMNAIYEEGRLKKGDLILLDAFGGGLTWGSALAYFG